MRVTRFALSTLPLKYGVLKDEEYLEGTHVSLDTHVLYFCWRLLTTDGRARERSVKDDS